jgi:hypothetical protein
MNQACPGPTTLCAPAAQESGWSGTKVKEGPWSAEPASGPGPPTTPTSYRSRPALTFAAAARSP